MTSRTSNNASKKTMQRLKSGELVNQPCWSFIKELSSVSEERLNSVAITDGYRQYTYRQMFRNWERYAEAFSGAGLTGENHSRVALISTPLPQSIFAFYALNMTGASVSLIYHIDLYDEKQIYSMIEREKITDLVISELFAFPNLMKRLLRDRELLGIRNIIVLDSPMGGDFAIPPLELIRDLNREMFRDLSGGLLMKDLLEKYEAFPISYGKEMAPIILHTTGTVSGMHKPVPQTDRAMNSFVLAAMEAKDNFEDFKKAPEHMVTYLPMYLSWAYVLVDMVHTSLSLGIEIVSLPMAATNPRYSEALEHYGVNVLFTSNSFLDTWLKTRPDIDLSKLKIVIMGGTYVSPEYKKEFNDYLRSCGSTARVINGYGLSEMGGACTIAPSSREDDAIGYLLPGFKAKIYVEDEGRCYDISDGPRTGILWLSSPTMSSGKLDDTVFFELEDVDGEEYFNSHDLVRVNKDSSLTCIGRSNHYFVNNAGVRFDAGLVETTVTSQPGIKACGLAPEFHKMLHDNVPVLYVEMTDPGLSDLGTLRQALVQVFMNDGLISDTNLPSQCVIVEHIPLNSSGKVDAKKLASGTVVGDRYSVKSIYTGDKMMDILLIPAAEGEFATMGAGIPQEFKGDPYNILSEIFALIPEINRGHFLKVFNISGIRELILKLTDFDIENIPLSLWNMVPKLLTMAYRDNLMPYLNGGKNMSRGKKTDNEFMAIFGKVQVPPMPPFMAKDGKTEWPDASKVKKDTNDFMDNCDSNMMTFWNQMIELQKSQIQSTRDQWMQFFDQLLEMQDTFAKNLPEELPVPPGFPAFPISPRYMMEQLKKYEEMSNDHFTEQADSLADFCIKSQEQSREVANTVVDKASDIRNDEETPAPAKKKTTKAKAAEPKPEPAKAKETKPKAKSTNTKKKTTKAKAAEPEPAKDNTEIVL